MINEEVWSYKKQSSDDSRPEEESVAELVRRAKSGDDQAFSVLYNLFSHRVSAYVTHIIQNREDVLDITQEAFLKAQQSLSQLQDERQFKVWIYHIARSRSIDYWRNSKRRRDQPLWEDDNEDHHPVYDTFEEQVEQRELVKEILAQLSPKQRRCLLLQVEGYKSEEIAECLGMSTRSVYRCIREAREQFHKAYQEFASIEEPAQMAITSHPDPFSHDASDVGQQTDGDQMAELDGAGSVLNESEHAQTVAELAMKINKLPDPYRKTLELKLLRRCSNREIAAQLQLPLGTIKSQISRGRSLLDKIVKQDESTEQPSADERSAQTAAELAIKINKLPDPYRKTLELKLLRQCSNQEIAAQLQLPLGTIKSQISRGRALLDKIVKQDESTEQPSAVNIM